MADARAVRPYKQTKFQQQKRCVGILTHPLFLLSAQYSLSIVSLFVGVHNNFEPASRTHGRIGRPVDP